MLTISYFGYGLEKIFFGKIFKFYSDIFSNYFPGPLDTTNLVFFVWRLRRFHIPNFHLDSRPTAPAICQDERKCPMRPTHFYTTLCSNKQSSNRIQNDVIISNFYILFFDVIFTN